jgi:3-oxoadipate enol-lactonase
MNHFQFTGPDGCPLFATTLGHGPTVVLLHGGGPDRRSLLPLAAQLQDRYRVVLPDIRGYGQSVCRDRSRHRWDQYVDDALALLDHLGARSAAVGGTGLGSTIAARAGLRRPDRFTHVMMISPEDIEDDQGKAAEHAIITAFVARAREAGLRAAWESILPLLSPFIADMVEDAIARTDMDSFLAAMAIVEDRAFTSTDELAGLSVPTLIVPGADVRHPDALARRCQETIPRATLAPRVRTAPQGDQP